MQLDPATRRKAARLLAQNRPRGAAHVYRRALRRRDITLDADTERAVLALLAGTKP